MRIVLLCAEDFSLGVACLSAYLKQRGHTVKVVFDPRQFEKAYAKNKRLAEIFSYRQLIVDEVADFKPDLAGFSVFTSNYQWALGLAGEMKKKIAVPIIFGGVHPTLVPEVVINEEAVDMVCIGDGEEPISELLDSLGRNMDYSIKNIWFKKGGEVIKNELRALVSNLDTLPLPDRDQLYAQLPHSYTRYPIVLTSYGCPYRCTYCANNALAEVYKGKGSHLRRRSPAHVITELKALKQKYNPRYILFMDDLFTFSKDWLREFAPAYAREIGLSYSCLTHTRFLDEEICALLKLSKCNIVLLGLQSGCEKIRREILERQETNEEYRRAVKFLKKYRIKFSLDNILNLPFDTEETIKESLDFYNELRPDIVHSFNLVYFPKTRIIEHGIKSGLLTEDSRSLINKGLAPNYMNVQLASKGDYRKYALLFTLVPLLPKRLMQKITDAPFLRRMVASFPALSILLVKFILNIRAGTGFVFFSVLRNECYYFKKALFLRRKLRCKAENEFYYTQ